MMIKLRHGVEELTHWFKKLCLHRMQFGRTRDGVLQTLRSVAARAKLPKIPK